MKDISSMAAVNAPRLRAEINGIGVDSVLRAEIMNRGSCRSSRFDLTISISKSTNTRWLNLTDGTVAVTISIYSGMPGNNTIVFEGLADSIAIDQTNAIARVHGRDYSSVLIDSSYQDSYSNQTASEIANSIALRHGLKANIAMTSTMVGGYQGDGYAQLLLNAHTHVMNEWELLVQLAKREEFELYIEGDTLVFAPMISLPYNNHQVNVGSVITVRFHKSCPISNQTTVTVKSWNSWLAQALHHSNGQSVSQPSADALDLNGNPGAEIAIVRPNLSLQDAERLANGRSALLKEQALTLQVTMPGDLITKPRDILTVTGTGGIFDANYVVESIRRQYSTLSGFIQHIEGYVAVT